MAQGLRKEVLLSVRQGDVRVLSFRTAQEINSFNFPDSFSNSDRYKSLYTKKESLARDAERLDANVTLALTSEGTMIGFGVLAYPDPGERWTQLGPKRMMEVRVIQVDRRWRRDSAVAQTLEAGGRVAPAADARRVHGRRQPCVVVGHQH